MIQQVNQKGTRVFSGQEYSISIIVVTRMFTIRSFLSGIGVDGGLDTELAFS